MSKCHICEHRSEEHGADYTISVYGQSVCPTCRIEQLEDIVELPAPRQRVAGTAYTQVDAKDCRRNSHSVGQGGGSPVNQITKKPHISETQLSMHAKCPEQWRRRYLEHDRIPPGMAMHIGSGVHKGAEANFRQKIDSHADLSSDDIVDAAVAGFEARIAGDGCSLSADDASRGQKVVVAEAKDVTAKLAKVHAEKQAPDYQPIEVEHTTRIVFPNASHDLLAITDLRVEGDRVVDIKTAGKKKSQADADDSTQLTTYAAAYQVDHGRPCKELLLDTLVKTKTPGRQVLTTHRTEADFRVLLARINAMLASIKTGVFIAAAPGAWWCSSKWCGYSRTCKFFNPERK